ncbi:MAG: metallophosphoesterase family protein [Candidatus Micrarchaeia archaeon]
MKIAIVSDTHLGYEPFAEDAYMQAKEALEKASSIADMILLPGDIFDKRFPRPDVLAQAFNIFRDLSHKEWSAKVVKFTPLEGSKSFTSVPIIAIPGTHERTVIGKENPLNLLALAGMLVDASESYVTVENNGESVSIFGLGGISEEQAKQKLLELNPKPLPGSFNIFVFHQSIFELLPFSEDFMHLSDLPKGFDLYVDGHIHSKYISSIYGKKFIIPGSTVLTQLKENEQEPKGFFVFDTKAYKEEFIQINSRPFKVIHIKFSNAQPSEIEQRCEQEINSAIDELSKDPFKRVPIVRLVLEGTIAGASDFLLSALAKRYSSKAVLSIDSSRLESPEIVASMEGVRESKIGEMPIKELGIRVFMNKLKEANFNAKVDVQELFNILSSPESKEKVLKEAMEHLSKEE